jgi:hypothetical protein
MTGPTGPRNHPTAAPPDPAAVAPAYPHPGPYPQQVVVKTGSRPLQIALVGLAVLMVVAGVAFRELDGGRDGSNANPPPVDAWDRTAASSYPVGEAGIGLPAATAVDGFTPAEVTADLGTVKKIMLAGRVDPTMLDQHDPSVLLPLIAPASRAAVRKRFDQHTFLFYGTQIAPGQTLAGAVRDKGTVTFSGGTEDGVRFLEVRTNVVWVYAFTGKLAAPGDHLVTLHETHTWRFPSAQDTGADQLGAYAQASQYNVFNMDCDQLAHDYLGLGKPLPGTDQGTKVGSDDVLDPSKPIDTTVHTCTR